MMKAVSYGRREDAVEPAAYRTVMARRCADCYRTDEASALRAIAEERINIGNLT